MIDYGGSPHDLIGKKISHVTPYRTVTGTILDITPDFYSEIYCLYIRADDEKLNTEYYHSIGKFWTLLDEDDPFLFLAE